MKLVPGTVPAAVFCVAATVVGIGVPIHGEDKVSPPPAGDGKPAPVNPYNGMQEREEVFEFAEKPKVEKQGDKRVITFASKGRCDATVAIVGPDGRIVRHLASGVLGKNAPWPFRQNSLSQKIEWDGEDDMGNKAPAGCKVRVSLGLRPKFERNIAWNPYFVPDGKNKIPSFVGKGPNGEVFLLVANDYRVAEGRVFKDGKYVRTFWPPSAKDLDKVAQAFPDKRFQGHWRLVKTIWGDQVPVSEDRYGIVSMKEVIMGIENLAKVVFALAGVQDYKQEPAPAGIARPPADWDGSSYYADGDGGEDCSRMAADRIREEVYFGNHQIGIRRFDGKTGKLDASFFPDGTLNKATECHVGPDGNLYLGIGYLGYFLYVMRVDHGGKPVDFGGDAVLLPQGWPGKWHDTGESMGQSPCPKAFVKRDVKVLWTGLRGHSNTHERGLYVSPRGYILFPDVFGDRARQMGYARAGPGRGGRGAEAQPEKAMQHLYPFRRQKGREGTERLRGGRQASDPGEGRGDAGQHPAVEERRRLQDARVERRTQFVHEGSAALLRRRDTLGNRGGYRQGIHRGEIADAPAGEASGRRRAPGAIRARRGRPAPAAQERLRPQ